MLVKMRSGSTEELYDFVAREFIARGLCTPLVDESKDSQTEAILKAKDQGGAATTVGVELAVAPPKQENAMRRFVRTARSVFAGVEGR